MSDHRSLMERGAKAKVIASVWEAEFVPFLTAMAVYSEEKVEFIQFFQFDRGKTAS